MVSYERRCWPKNGQSDQIKNYRYSQKKKEWILILEKKIIGQDQHDRQDNAAFGRKAPRRRRKNS
jgi:hypothetical protein